MQLKRWNAIFIAMTVGSTPLLGAELKDNACEINARPELLDDDPFVFALQADPVGVYLKYFRRALKAKLDGQPTFLMGEEFMPKVRQILARIQSQLDRKDLPAPSLAIFKQLRHDGKALLKRKVPYHDFIRWSMSTLRQVDADFRRARPEFSSYYHENLAKEVIEESLAKWPYVLAFPSFQSVGFDYFLDTRVAPFHLFGASMTNLFGDGYELPPAEWSFHDWGHIEFLSLRDIDHLTDAHGEIESTLLDWLANRDQILGAMRRLKEYDPDLFAPVRVLLFEIIHERGYPYDLSRLKAQFETRKWTEIIERKLTNNFWQNMIFSPAQLSRLTEARMWLLSLTKRLITEKNIKQIHWMNAHKTPVQIRYIPPVDTFTGRFREAVFTIEGRLALDFDTQSGSRKSSIYDVSLAQISEQGVAEYSPETIAKIEQALWIQWKGTQVFAPDDVERRTPLRIVKIFVTEDGIFRARLHTDTAKDRDVELEQIIVPYEVTTNEFAIKDVEIYKLRQVLSLNRQGREATSIVQERAIFTEAKIEEVFESGHNEKSIRFKPLGESQSTERPLADITLYSRGAVLLTLDSLHVAATDYAHEYNLFYVPSHLAKQIHLQDRPVTLLVPDEPNTEQILEIAHLIRSLKHREVASIVLATPRGSNDFKKSALSRNPELLKLFGAAGADAVRASKVDLLPLSAGEP